MALKQELNLITLTLYGVGIILGAGIYALIGTGAGLAGNMLWLAFLLSAIIAAFTGLSYSKLSSMFPKDAAEYVYTKNAFKREWFSFLVGWIVIAASIISGAVVALAFGGYLSYIIGGSSTLYAVALIVLLSALNYLGMKESALFNNFAAIIEAGGLIAVIIIGLLFSGNNIEDINFLELPDGGFSGIFSAIAVIFFAFIGFESIANVSEEVKNNKTVVPKAILLSLGISSLLYILLSVAILNLVSWQELASSPAPLTTAVEKVIPNAAFIISVIALFATSNTVLIILIGASRILYGMSSQGSLPGLYSALSSRGTPYLSVAFAGISAIAAALYGDIKSVAALTDLGIFIAYLFVNISLIWLVYKNRTTAWFSIARIPVIPVLGALSCLFMFFYFDIGTWLIELLIIIIGFVLFNFYHIAHQGKRSVMNA